MRQPVYHHVEASFSPEGLKVELIKGLENPEAFISPKFLYDNLGSHLFTAITHLPEYYPTKTEKQITQQYQAEIARALGENTCLIDLGAGNCQKAESLFDALKPSSYVAVDFSIEYLQDILPKLQSKFPTIEMMGVGMDFSSFLSLPGAVAQTRRNFFYPGSSIGNFSQSEAAHLLRQIQSNALGGGLLLGVDLMKEDSVLLKAYDDPLKLTAAFNLNILRVVNPLIDANFDVQDFRHTITINHALQRVELYLEAVRDVNVAWTGGSRKFKAGELIHTENSHKYSLSSIQALLSSSGFERFQTWSDPKNYFALIYAE
jgi:dimethylhistidine N-methyltransferase